MTALDAALADAAKTYWQNNTTSMGHLDRAVDFIRAESLLRSHGQNKTNARKRIAEQLNDNAPAHEKTVGAPTVAQYIASYDLMCETSSLHAPTIANRDLYAVVHKAYAASMGADNIRKILSAYSDQADAISRISALKRPVREPNEDGKPRGKYGLKNALAALAKIQEHEWDESEKEQLFTAALATSVAVQPDPDDDGA